MQYEEGEIVSENEVDDYCMLEPAPLRTLEPRVPGRVVPDDPLSSDDDLPHLCPPPRPSNHLAKFNQWTLDVSEELSYSLNSSLLSQSYKEDRHIENYPHHTAALHFNGSNDGVDDEYVGNCPRFLPRLSVTCNHSMKQITQDICKKLKESNQQLIYNVVSVLGKKRALSFYKKTRLMEKNGGLLITNKSRQRTSGGVFFYLINCDKSINASQLKEIFHESNLIHNRSRHRAKKKNRKKRKLHDKHGESVPRESGLKRESISESGEVEGDEALGTKTPPPSPAAPTSPHQPSVDAVLDQTSALLARTNDMQVE